MGDIILTLPAIAYIRQENPRARLTMAVRPMFAQFVSDMQVVEEALPLDYPKRSSLALHRVGPFLGQLARMRRRFDVAFDFRGDARNAMIGAWSARIVAGSDAPGTSFLLSSRYREGEILPMAARNLRIVSLEQATVPRVEDYASAFRYRVADEVRAGVSRLAGSRDGYVLIHPGASRPSNRWDADRWRNLIRLFLESGELVAITGTGPEDSQLVSTILDGIEPRDAVSNLVNRTSSAELTPVVKKARLVISPDTGIAHIAFAHRVPSVTLFGSDSEMVWGHASPIHRPLGISLPCRPCSAYRCPRNDHPMECMDSITVEQVYSAAKAALQASSQTYSGRD